MQSHLAHLNQHQSTAYDHAVHTKANVEKVARAVMAKMDHAQPLLDKHFKETTIPASTFAPKKVYNQTMYMPY